MSTWIMIFSGMIIFLFYRLRIQEERCRVLAAFTGGLFERSVKTVEVIERLGRKIDGVPDKETPQMSFRDTPEYEYVMGYMTHYFNANHWAQSWRKLSLSKEVVGSFY